MAYINTVTLDYPLSFADIRAAHPSVSFSAPPDADELAQFDYVEVLQVDPPVLPASETLVEADPVEIDGVWTQQWDSRPATEAELLLRCNYQAFWDALLISKVYQAIRAKACTDLSVNVCCTEFVAALSDAKAGRANKDAIQTCIHLILQADEFTAEQLAELQQLLVTGNMQNVYHLS